MQPPPTNLLTHSAGQSACPPDYIKPQPGCACTESRLKEGAGPAGRGCTAVSPLHFMGCVTLHQLFNLSELQFLMGKMGVKLSHRAALWIKCCNSGNTEHSLLEVGFLVIALRTAPPAARSALSSLRPPPHRACPVARPRPGPASLSSSLAHLSFLGPGLTTELSLMRTISTVIVAITQLVRRQADRGVVGTEEVRRGPAGQGLTVLLIQVILTVAVARHTPMLC